MVVDYWIEDNTILIKLEEQERKKAKLLYNNF
jgi:hypothetical protein